MKDAHLTKQERNFIAIMRIWVVAFLFAATLFAMIPDILLQYLNDLGLVFAGWHSPAAIPSVRFWVVLSVASFLGLAYACALAAAKPLQYSAFAQIVILVKLASAIGLVWMLFADGPQFYYLVGAILDGVIALITWRTYARAVFSRNSL